MKELTSLEGEFDFLYGISNDPLQQAIHDLPKAFANCFQGAGFPTFHKKSHRVANTIARYPAIAGASQAHDLAKGLVTIIGKYT